MQTIERVRQGLARFRTVTEEDLRRLKAVHAAYGDSDLLVPVLTEALAAAEDWHMLGELISRKPVEARTRQDNVLLVHSHLNLGRYEDANNVLLPLIERDPANVALRVLAAHAYSFLEEYEKAATVLDEVWTTVVAEQNAEACLVRGQLYFYSEDNLRARQLLELGLSMEGVPEPIRLRLHNAMARVLSAAGDAEGAERHAARSSELYAALTEQERRAMRFSARTQQLNQAMAARDFEECERLIHAMLPDADRRVQAGLYRYLAEVYTKSGRPDDARAATERARLLGGSPD